MMTVYRVDVQVAAYIEDIRVEIDPDTRDFRSQLIAAANEVIADKLTMIDLKGGRSGSDGFVKAASVTALTNWDSKS